MKRELCLKQVLELLLLEQEVSSGFVGAGSWPNVSCTAVWCGGVAERIATKLGHVFAGLLFAA